MANKKTTGNESGRKFVDRWTSDGAGIVMGSSNSTKKKPATKKSKGKKA